MILRWQIGPHGLDSWRALGLSIKLMKRLEPDADYHVVYQGNCGQQVGGVAYHAQESLYSHGRFHWPFATAGQQTVTIENDHLMWQLPPAWHRWKGSKATLAWLVDWDYYGTYAERVGGFRACPGIYGLPPNVLMPPPPERERGQDQEEQGYVASWLREHPPHEIITIEEVSCYMPTHPILGTTHDKFGSCGTHFAGLNRQWNPMASQAMDEIERRWL